MQYKEILKKEVALAIHFDFNGNLVTDKGEKISLAELKKSALNLGGAIQNYNKCCWVDNNPYQNKMELLKSQYRVFNSTEYVMLQGLYSAVNSEDMKALPMVKLPPFDTPYYIISEEFLSKLAQDYVEKNPDTIANPDGKYFTVHIVDMDMWIVAIHGRFARTTTEWQKINHHDFAIIKQHQEYNFILLQKINDPNNTEHLRFSTLFCALEKNITNCKLQFLSPESPDGIFNHNGEYTETTRIKRNNDNNIWFSWGSNPDGNSAGYPHGEIEEYFDISRVYLSLIKI